MQRRSSVLVVSIASALALRGATATAQLTDKTQTTASSAGINKSFAEEVGAGRGDEFTPDSSIFLIERDPFRSIRRGRQIFQRKFTRHDGHGPRVNDDSTGDLTDPAQAALGAGLVDSCAGCQGRPRGSAGVGGDVATRPDSRDAPHLFGLGLREMLADEITQDLRAIRTGAITQAKQSKAPVSRRLQSKGIDYGSITARADGSVDTSKVRGVDPDLRVRPFFAQGKTISMREFLVGAFKAEMGLEAVDPDLLAASGGAHVVTPSGMVLDGSLDQIEAPPVANESEDGDGDGVVNEIPTAIVDHMEFYLLNYFKPGTYRETPRTDPGLALFVALGCQDCHRRNLQIDRDRRVADVETVYDPNRGIFNHLFATASLRLVSADDGSGFPALKHPEAKPFLVRDIFTDFKRHDLGPDFYERNYDGSFQTEFVTRPLWGVGSTGPYGHDGRTINLREVILRHGGEAQLSRDAFAALPVVGKVLVEDFLNSLILFPPDDTASNLDPGDRSAPDFPQRGHGSIKLSVLFNDPSDLE